MKTEITKGIIYGETYLKDDYQIIFGFYDNKFSNKNQLIEIIRKTGDYTNRMMKGEIVNIFDNFHSSGSVYGESRTSIMAKEGITAGILHGSGLRFNGELRAILERNGEAQKLRDMSEDIIKRTEAVGKDRQKFEDLFNYLQEKYNFTSEAAIDCMMSQGYSYDAGEEKEPSIFQNLFIRIPQVAKETGLTHLTLLPICDRDKSLENNVISFLAAKREGRGNKPVTLYVKTDSILFDDAVRSIDMIR